MKSHTTVSAYIAHAPKTIRPLLRKLRATIRRAAPRAIEDISYGMPAYRLNGHLVYFGGFKSHVSFFPGRSGIRQYVREAGKYRGGTGTLRFPSDRPVPYALVAKITTFRMKENLRKKK